MSIWTNFVESTSLMLHINPKGHQPTDSRENGFRDFTIYSSGDRLVKLPEQFAFILLNNCRDYSYEIWVKHFSENYVLKYWCDSNMGNLGSRSKVNLRLWKWFRLKISIKNNEFGFSSSQNINFHKIFPCECIRKQFDLYVKQVKVNLGS